MSKEFERGVLVGYCIALVAIVVALKLKQMQSDIDWCKVYVDQHLDKEQKEFLRKREEKNA